MAETYILLRGLGRESGHWLEFAGALADAVAPSAVHCLDLPGNGSRCRDKSPCLLDNCVAPLRRECQERGLAPPYRIIGLSMGGMVGLCWLRLYPDEICDLVMVNSSLASLSPFYHRMKPGAFFRLLAGLFSIRQRERAVKKLSFNLRRHDPTILPALLDIAQRHPVKAGNLLRQLYAASRFRCDLPLHSERICLLASRRDRLVDVRCSQALAMHWQLPICIHEAAGHDLPVDDPAWTVAQLLLR